MKSSEFERVLRSSSSTVHVMNRLSAAGPTPSALAVARFAAGMTQSDLAERARVTRVAVANLESGKHRPRRLTAESIAAVLGVEPADIFPPIYDNAPVGTGTLPRTDVASSDREP
jgi:transcriptional regulator with XRE-family HTH domain